MSREVALGWASWTSFTSSCPSCSSTAVQQTLSLWLCPAQQLEHQLCSAQVAGQWRGDTALTLPLFWRRSTVSPVFFGRFPRSSLSLSRPHPTLSPSLIGHLASVDVKQHERKGVAQSRHAFVGGTMSTWARWRIPVHKDTKGIRNADQALAVRGEHVDRIVGYPAGSLV